MGTYDAYPAGSRAPSPPHGERRSIFEHYTNADVTDLIAEYPLAWVNALGGPARHATLLPLLTQCDADGRITALIGHMARRNPLAAALVAQPRAQILFTGPQAYVSPTLVADRSWVPTWNYAQVRIDGVLEFHPDGGDAALAMLVEAMEAGRPGRWHVENTGERYRRMEQEIIAFAVRVDAVSGRFKLGQDEQPDIASAIIANHPDGALVRWMRRFNDRREPT